METVGLYRLLYCLLLHGSWYLLRVHATFTEVPADVSVEVGSDISMPCTFRASSPTPMALEITWWYLKQGDPQDLSQDLQTNSKDEKVNPREANKISAVRVQGNAISHRLSLSKVKKEDEGVYECRVSDLWADDPQEFTVHATLHVTPVDGMVAEEAVSHIQSRWPLRNANTAQGEGGAAGRATLEPGLGPELSQGMGGGQGKAGGQRFGVHQQAPPGLLPSVSTSTTTTAAKSSASPLQGSRVVLQEYRADDMRPSDDGLAPRQSDLDLCTTPTSSNSLCCKGNSSGGCSVECCWVTGVCLPAIPAHTLS